jgi:serine phosphatase RsbU (regulator of sigma subunit)
MRADLWLPQVSGSAQNGFAEAIAEVARQLQAEGSAQATLQTMVELAVSTIRGCDHAGVSIVEPDDEIDTPAASDDVPRQVDALQYESNEGPCLDAIRAHAVFQTDDLEAERRWPNFSSRATRKTGVRSMLSFRLFVEQGTLGALNLYSKRTSAFDADSLRIGEVFAAHAAVALEGARERDRAKTLEDDLEGSQQQARRYARQAQFAVALQQGILSDLPDRGPLELAARYVPAREAAEVGGDWYDAFRLPHGATAIVVGDLAGHDIDAAVRMAQTRSLLRALAIDRDEPPGRVLCRLDAVLAQLHEGQTGTCVYGQLAQQTGTWTALLANAGHLPPLVVTPQAARYLDHPAEAMLGVPASPHARTSVTVPLPPGATLLLYTDGLIERRDRSLDETLAELRDAAAHLGDQPPDQLCDRLVAQFAAEPSDDVCILAVRIPACDTN